MIWNYKWSTGIVLAATHWRERIKEQCEYGGYQHCLLITEQVVLFPLPPPSGIRFRRCVCVHYWTRTEGETEREGVALALIMIYLIFHKLHFMGLCAWHNEVDAPTPPTTATAAVMENFHFIIIIIIGFEDTSIKHSSSPSPMCSSELKYWKVEHRTIK